MAKPKFVSSGDAAVDKAIQSTHGGLSDLGVLEGARTIDGIALTSGAATRVAHGLGRKWRGCLVTELTAAATVTRSKTATDRDRYVTLTASADTTISILVF